MEGQGQAKRPGSQSHAGEEGRGPARDQGPGPKTPYDGPQGLRNDQLNDQITTEQRNDDIITMTRK